MWIAKAGDQSIAHSLDGSQGYRRQGPSYALCGVALQPAGDGGTSDMPRCPKCQELWNAENPRRKPAGHVKKFVRHRCPDCEDEHIIRPARTEP